MSHVKNACFFFFFHSEKAWAEWWHDSPGILKMHISLKMHIFIGFRPTSGLFWESGGMAGWQQAPAGNHRHGHLGRAGKNENFFYIFFLTTWLLLHYFFSFMLSCWIKMFLSTCRPYMHKTLDPSRGGRKSGLMYEWNQRRDQELTVQENGSAK